MFSGFEILALIVTFSFLQNAHVRLHRSGQRLQVVTPFEHGHEPALAVLGGSAMATSFLGRSSTMNKQYQFYGWANFGYNQTTLGWQIGVYDRETGKTFVRTQQPGAGMRPELSPDGKWLAISILDADVYDTGDAQVALVNVNSCEVIPLTGVVGEVRLWVP